MEGSKICVKRFGGTDFNCFVFTNLVSETRDTIGTSRKQLEVCFFKAFRKHMCSLLGDVFNHAQNMQF